MAACQISDELSKFITQLKMLRKFVAYIRIKLLKPMPIGFANYFQTLAP